MRKELSILIVLALPLVLLSLAGCDKTIREAHAIEPYQSVAVADR